MDAHTLLGLSPGASKREVKHAFRRLAMRWHPDRNPDPAALEHFKMLRAAYETMLAGLAAANGDGSGDAADGAGATTGGPGDPAAAASGATAADASPRGPDRRQDLMLSLEEAFFGGETTVEVEDAAPCDVCDGGGEEQLTHTRLCVACHGSGRIRSKSGLVGCGRCAGRGYVSKQPCAACDGTGERRRRRPVTAEVPAGVLDGDELRVRGAGEVSAVGGVPGDLILTVALVPHPLYRLVGRDLVVSRPVSAFRMLLGGELPVPLPGGVRNVKLAPGSAAPRELRVRGAGFPGRDGQAPGALLVRLVPVLPDTVDRRARRLLEQLENELDVGRDAAMPDLANWEARWLAARD